MTRSSLRSVRALLVGDARFFLTCGRPRASCGRVFFATSSSAAPIPEGKPRSFRRIPGPAVLPVIGTMWQFFPIVGNRGSVSRMHEMYAAEFDKYGPIYKWVIPGGANIVLLNDPDDFETMRWYEEKFPTRRILGPIKHYRERWSKHKLPHCGVLLLNGERWYRLRTKFQSRLMKPKSALQYLEPMQAVATDFVDRIRLLRDKRDEAPADFQNELYKWALESISCVALDTRLGCLAAELTAESDAQRMITATNETFQALNYTENRYPIWKYWPTPAFRRLIAAQDTFTEIALKYISRTLEQLETEAVDTRDASVLELLLTRDDLSQGDVLVLMLDLLTAGIDTTSHSMGFLLYQLARNPEKQAVLRDEIDRVVGDGKLSAVTPKELNSLSYLKACVRESMRMQPVVGGILREFGKDVVIRNYLIPKGTWVYAFSYGACQNPDHFPEPQKFRPERWLRGDEKQKMHPYASFPFGFASRMCLGRRFAELEMWLLTTKLLQNFDIGYHYDDIGMRTRFLNIPDKPLKFQFCDR